MPRLIQPSSTHSIPVSTFSYLIPLCHSFCANGIPTLTIHSCSFFTSVPRKHSPPRNSPRRATFNTNPSPLRVERAAPAEPVVSAISSLTSPNHDSAKALPTLEVDFASSLTLEAPPDSKLSPESSSPANGPSTNNEDDDNVPLEYVGYAILAKKRKEEKERFLAAERAKREHANGLRQAEEAKRRVEAERKRAEEDVRKAEEERVRLEEARKHAEMERKAFEEKQKAIFDEEVAAARRRRENARLGVENHNIIREMNREKRGEVYARPAYDISPQPGLAKRRSSAYFPAPDSPVEKAGSSPTNLPSVAEDKEKSERRKSSLPPSSFGKPTLNPEPARPSVNRHQSMPKQEQREPFERPESVISTTSSAHAKRQSHIRSSSAPNTLFPQQQMPPMVPYPMMPIQVVPPVPPMPVWNMSTGMGMPSMPPMPPLMMPTAPFMMQHSPHSGTPSPVSGSPGTGNPFNTVNNRSRSRSRSRDQQDSSPSRRQSVIQTRPPSNVPIPGHATGASSARSRHSIYSQAQGAAAGSGSLVSLNRSNPHLGGAASPAPPTSTSRSPAKRMSSLPPHALSPQPMPNLPREHSRMSVYGNVPNAVHPRSAPAPQKRRTTMM